MTVELVGGPHCGKVFEVQDSSKYRVTLRHGSRHAAYWRESSKPYVGRVTFLAEGMPLKA